MSENDDLIDVADMAAIAEEHGGRAAFWWPDPQDEDQIVGLIARCVATEPLALTFTGAQGEVFRVLMRPEDLAWILANPVPEE